MKEEEGIFFGIWGIEVGHGRAKLLEFWGFWHGKSGTGRAKVLAFWAQIFFSFS